MPSPHHVLELELELIQAHMAQKPMLRGEVGARVLRVRSDVRGHGQVRLCKALGCGIFPWNMLHLHTANVHSMSSERYVAMRIFVMYCAPLSSKRNLLGLILRSIFRLAASCCGLAGRLSPCFWAERVAYSTYL